MDATDVAAHYELFLTHLSESLANKSTDAFVDLFLPTGWLRE